MNPAARRGAQDAIRTEHALRRLGVRLTVARTTGVGDAAALARARPADCDAVFVLGGDGTTGEVLGALAGRASPVGVLPAGAGNLLARALEIPLDPLRAARALCAGRTRVIDLAALAGGRHFAVAAGVGIDARMVLRTGAAFKRHVGVLAYVVEGSAATFRAIRQGPFEATITVDGIAHRADAVSILVANVGALFGGRITLAPGAQMDDGMLDVCVYSARGVRDVVRTAWRGWRGRFPPDALVRFHRGKHVHVSVDPLQPMQADGEALGTGVLDVRVARGAGLVLVPAAA